jgi:arsenate reductase-like glutaredoxin family protein
MITILLNMEYLSTKTVKRKSLDDTNSRVDLSKERLMNQAALSQKRVRAPLLLSEQRALICYHGNKTKKFI